MGVQGLWELLAPVGRRVSVETLAGKKLAIDASIWMIQFMKAMRDDKGEMVRNAHLLGFFRRICKLLFLRTKPVFVFDGGTPALKRRTVAARRRHRDTARAKIRKTAEKLLLNHLKSRKLEELAEEIKNQRKADDDLKGKKGKGKQVVDETPADEARCSGPSNQESLDELLAKSLAAEEETGFGDKHAYAGDARGGEEEDDDEDEEMIFPVTGDNIDPTVLASLPPSMQLDLLGQMRERLMAENRQKYQKIKKVPSKFSELQIQSYLKTVAFRREIDKVQKCAAGRGIGGVQTSRIASEANREFIFSSSFTGDKQMLTSTGVQVNGEPDHSLKRKSATAELLKNISSTSRSKATSATDGKLVQGFGDDVETYCDERGRVRVSRVRGLGMRMTRDIQRNLDLLYEYEQEKKIPDIGTDPEPSCTKEVRNVSKSHSEVYQAGGASTSNDGTNHCDEQSMLGSEAAIEISFSEDDDGTKDIDDYFLHLVSGSSTSKLFSRTANSEKNGNDSDSECVWEEGSVEKKESWEDDNKKSCTALAGRSSFEEDEVDWEEGTLCLNSDEGTQLPKVTAHFQAEHENLLLNRQLDEEADIQEAIRRSLEDYKTPMSSSISNFNANVGLGMSIEAQSDVGPFLHNSTPDNNSVDACATLKVSPEMDSSCRAATDGPGHADFVSGKYVPQNDKSPEKHLSSSTFSGVDGKSYSVDELDEKLLVSSAVNRRSVDMLNVNDLRGIQIEQCINASKLIGDEPHIRISTENLPESHSDISLKIASKMADTVISDANDFDAPKSSHSFQERITDSQNISLIGESRNNREQEQFIEGVNGVQMVEPDSFRGESTTLEYSKSSHSFPERQDNIDSQNISLIGGLMNNVEPGLFIERDNGVQSVEPDNFGGETMTQEYLHDHVEVTQANLDEEISLLRQERIDLGDEQRKHERNAESVSSEMFAECQELLQMFGLPYIIAPMEAEAQCAYMELSNLVDGVVTDDSDVFLFGARSVYKNIFDDRKYVETYLMKDIESELGLSRDKLIHMAMLLGSDYTEGVSGIGIVNAIEVVRAFPEEDGLQKFREWVESPDPSILGKFDPQNASKLKRTPSKASKQGANGVQDNVGELLSEESTSKVNGDQPPDDTASDIKTIFMNTHRTVSKNWHLPSSFPSELVVSAYISPQVDESTVPFSWGRPDLVLLRKLCWERFGWSNQKADELLVPVLKEHNKHETQLRLEAFYSFNERFAKIRSKRINKAVKGITGTSKSELMHEHVHEESNSRGKKRSRPSASEECNPDGKTSSGRKSSKTPKTQNHTTDGVGDSLNLDHDGKNNDSGTTANMRGSGRGRGRGRGKSRGRGRGGRGRGRGRGEVAHQSPQESTSDKSNDADEIHESAMGPEATSDLRRSMRPRKHVKFLDENVELSDASDSSNQKEEGGMCNAAVDQDKIEKNDSLNRSGRQRPVDSVSEDCYVSGGGFCVDEDDTIQPVAASTSREIFDKGSDARFEDTSGLDEGLEDSSSRAYLFGGGGFCVDESDEAQLIASPVKDSIDKSAGAGDSGVKRAIGQDAYGDEKEGKPGLTAMPWLRRKRRKA